MIKTFKVYLTTPRDVSEFANAASNCPRDITVRASHGEFAVDAKSIMGLYSLNLSQPITIEIISDTNKDIDDSYFNALKKWAVANT